MEIFTQWIVTEVLLHASHMPGARDVGISKKDRVLMVRELSKGNK